MQPFYLMYMVYTNQVKNSLYGRPTACGVVLDIL